MKPLLADLGTSGLAAMLDNSITIALAGELSPDECPGSVSVKLKCSSCTAGPFNDVSDVDRRYGDPSS